MYGDDLRTTITTKQPQLSSKSERQILGKLEGLTCSGVYKHKNSCNDIKDIFVQVDKLFDIKKKWEQENTKCNYYYFSECVEDESSDMK